MRRGSTPATGCIVAAVSMRTAGEASKERGRSRRGATKGLNREADSMPGLILTVRSKHKRRNRRRLVLVPWARHQGGGFDQIRVLYRTATTEFGTGLTCVGVRCKRRNWAGPKSTSSYSMKPKTNHLIMVRLTLSSQNETLKDRKA